MDPYKRIIDLTIAEFENIISKTVKNNLQQQTNNKPANLQKQFYSPKEFGLLIGKPYSTVIFDCTHGKLKARQDNPGCSWQIAASELDRYTKEAIDNVI